MMASLAILARTVWNFEALSARTKGLGTRLFLTVRNSQQCQDLNTGAFLGYTEGTVDYSGSVLEESLGFRDSS